MLLEGKWPLAPWLIVSVKSTIAITFLLFYNNFLLIFSCYELPLLIIGIIAFD